MHCTQWPFENCFVLTQKTILCWRIKVHDQVNWLLILYPGRGTGLSEAQPGWSRAFEEECRKTGRIKLMLGIKVEKHYLRSKITGCIYFKEKEQCGDDWWVRWFMISVWKEFTSLAVSLGQGVNMMMLGSEILNFWHPGYGQLLRESMPTKQKECKLSKGAGAHTGTWNKPVPWMWHFFLWTFIFLKRAHLEFWKSKKDSKQKRRGAEERVCIYVMWKKETLNIF